MSWLYTLEIDDARSDIVFYLETQDEDYFAERGRTKEEVLSDGELIDKLAAEHQKCVNSFGCEREWSCRDACDNEPGIWKGECEE